MKKTVMTLSVLIFVLALVASGTAWADDGPGEGSGTKTEKSAHGDSKDYKDKEHSKEYKAGEAGHPEEGSGGKQPHDKQADHKKKEEGSSDSKEMK